MPYNPPHDRTDDPAVLRAFIEDHPLGALVTSTGAGLDADFLPFMVEDQAANGDERQTAAMRLIAHCALANPLVDRVADGDDVLVVFGPVEHYVSPNWYPSKLEHHRVVPTWNYMTAHAWGRITLHRDPSWLRTAVARLTNQEERRQSALTGETAWRVGQAPKDYVDDMLGRIVGVSIEVSRAEGRFKVSANKTPKDAAGASEGIARSAQRGSGRAAEELAEAMRRR